MSASGGKADMAQKRDKSANDPKRTSAYPSARPLSGRYRRTSDLPLAGKNSALSRRGIGRQILPNSSRPTTFHVLIRGIS